MLESQNTLDSTPARTIPVAVNLTDNQVKEALGLYLDHIFEAPHGTYKVESWDNAFSSFEVKLKRSLENIP